MNPQTCIINKFVDSFFILKSYKIHFIYSVYFTVFSGIGEPIPYGYNSKQQVHLNQHTRKVQARLYH